MKMNLPTQAQVNTAGRYAGAVAGTAIAIFGLQAKGISLDQVKAGISALGTVVNDIVVLIGIVAPLYATIKGVVSSSPVNQAAAVAATGAKVVTTPEIAAAVPSPNVTSNTETQVTPK
jgi:hypothetical protein